MSEEDPKKPSGAPPKAEEPKAESPSKRPSSPWPSARKSESPPAAAAESASASDAPPAAAAAAAAAADEREKAPWGKPLDRFDRAWSKLDARLCAFVLMCDVFTLVLWISLKALSATGKAGP